MAVNRLISIGRTKLVAEANRIWRRTQLDSPRLVRKELVPRLHNLKEVLRLAARPRMHVYELSGFKGGNPITVTFVNVRFFGRFIEPHLFDGPPHRRLVGTVPFWQYRKIARWPSGDLVLFEGTRHLTARLAQYGGIVSSQGIRHVLETSHGWDEVHSRFHKEMRRQQRLCIESHQYKFEISHDEKDFEEFYYKMYMPLISERHGDLVAPASINQAREIFRNGALCKVVRGDKWVAGSLYDVQDDTIRGHLNGVIGADSDLIDEGAIMMSVLGPIKLATEQEIPYMDLQASGPFLNSGLFTHKRRWGGSISLPPDLYRRIWLRVNNLTPAVNRFLLDHPMVVIDRRDALEGLVFVQDTGNLSQSEIKSIKKKNATPGMDKLVIRSTSQSCADTEDDIVLPIDSSHTAEGNGSSA